MIQTGNPQVVAIMKEGTMITTVVVTTTEVTEETIVAEVAKDTGQEMMMQTIVDSKGNVEK